MKEILLKIQNKISNNKKTASIILVFFLTAGGYFLMTDEDRENDYFCMYEVFTEEGKNVASKGEGDEWELTDTQANWVMKNCPETVWTTKAEKAKKNASNTETKNEMGNETKKDSALDSVPDCNQNSKYTVLPLKETDFFSIRPLGNLNPSSHTFPTDHIYLETTNSEGWSKSNQKSRPLYSPGDIWVSKISKSENRTMGVADYDIEFYLCKDIKGQFGHVGTLSEKIASKLQQPENCNEYTTGGRTYRRCSYELGEEIKAGEKIGTAGDGQSGMLDIWAIDYRLQPIEFANPKRWRTDSFYVTCPADHFTAELKDTLLKRFIGPNNGVRTKEPVCGTIDVDVKNTAQGAWFPPGGPEGPGSEDRNVALVSDNVETDKQVFSMGLSGVSKGFKSGTYSFTPKSTGLIDRNFSEVQSDGKIYCYNTSENTRSDGSKKWAIYLTMPNSTTIRIEKSGTGTCGTDPWEMKNSIEFVR